MALNKGNQEDEKLAVSFIKEQLEGNKNVKGLIVSNFVSRKNVMEALIKDFGVIKKVIDHSMNSMTFDCGSHIEFRIPYLRLFEQKETYSFVVLMKDTPLPVYFKTLNFLEQYTPLEKHYMLNLSDSEKTEKANDTL